MRPESSKELTWTTKDGRVLKPADFEDLHLKNTIAFIERTGPLAIAKHCLAGGDPITNNLLRIWYRDAAWGIPDHDDPLDSEPPLEYLIPIYGALVAEAKKRGFKLEPPPKQIRRPEN